MTTPTPEQMRALADEGTEVPGVGYYDWIKEATPALFAAANEVDRLRAVIENAPHDVDCDMRLNESIRIPEDKCTCWKRDVL